MSRQLMTMETTAMPCHPAHASYLPACSCLLGMQVLHLEVKKWTDFCFNEFLCCYKFLVVYFNLLRAYSWILNLMKENMIFWWKFFVWKIAINVEISNNQKKKLTQCMQISDNTRVLIWNVCFCLLQGNIHDYDLKRSGKFKWKRNSNRPNEKKSPQF